MARYSYTALDSRGQESTGLVEAASTTEAIGQLRQKGFFPTNVSEEGMDGPTKTQEARRRAKAPRSEGKGRARSVVLFRRRSVKPKTLMIFTRQLATLIDAGLPLLRG